MKIKKYKNFKNLKPLSLKSFMAVLKETYISTFSLHISYLMQELKLQCMQEIENRLKLCPESMYTIKSM